MRQRGSLRARATVRSIAVLMLVAPAGVAGRAQQPPDDAPSKRGGVTRAIPAAPAVDAPVLDDVAEALDAIRSRGAVRHVRLQPSGRVAAVYGDLGAVPRAGAKAEVTDDDAIDYVARVAPLVGTSDPARDLRVERRADSALGERVALRQFVGRYPVFGAVTTLDVARDGKVFGLTSSFAPGIDPALADAEPAVDEQAARATALDRLSVTPERLRADDPFTAELGAVAIDSGRLAWRVVVPTREPYGQWEVVIDAFSGAVVGEPRNLVAFAGSAKVFVPNPIVSTGDTGLKDESNAASAVPDSAYVAVALSGLDTSGFVTGPFCSTARTTDRASAANGDFSALRRSDRGFDEVEAYWAIDTAQRYIQQTLGIRNAANYQIQIDVHFSSVDNSNYTPTASGRGVLNFGDGGVDDAQDAEIVWHEYGHAVLDNQAQIQLGFGESGAIHEGWGDYFAATLSTTVPGDPRFYPTIGEWDATSYSYASPPYLRRVDGTKQFPYDMDGEVHDDGEIWSSCLWGIHEALGRAVADPIIFNANFLFPYDVGFEDAAAAVLEADAQLNGGANASAIDGVFAAHGITAQVVTPSVSRVRVSKSKLVVDGADFEQGGAVIEVDGTAFGALRYPPAYRHGGTSRRVTTKDARVRSLARGVTVQVTVLNPRSGLRSAPFALTP